MPLPDANKKSPRVYTNLQNLDLDNVTFANIQATGNPIAVEEMNEDEMRRLVLVNLARLVTAGEWNGLLTAGGGGGMEQVAVLSAASSKYFSITKCGPWGSGEPGDSDTINYETPVYCPFVAPASGAVAGLSVNLTSAAAGAVNFLCGIYDSEDGLPNDLLGYATMDMNVSTGEIRQTSFSSTITTTRGSLYYVAWTRSTTQAFTLSTVHRNSQAALGPTRDVANNYMALSETGTDNTLPASATVANLLAVDEERPMINLDW